MDTIQLTAKKRDKTGKRVKVLRQENQIPAVLYGHQIESVSLSVDYMEFGKIIKQGGESSIIDLKIDTAEPRKAIIKEIQIDPLSNKYIHLDFYQVKMKEKMKANVPLKFVGVSLAVKDSGGILVKNFDEMEVECLPADLPKEIVVNIDNLKTFEDVIRVKDIKIPAGVKFLAEDKEVVATVTPPRSEEELEELNKQVEEKVEEVEGIEKKEEEMEAAGEEGKAAESKEPKKEEGKKKE